MTAWLPSGMTSTPRESPGTEKMARRDASNGPLGPTSTADQQVVEQRVDECPSLDASGQVLGCKLAQGSLDACDRTGRPPEIYRR